MDQICWNGTLLQGWQQLICGVLEIVILSSGIYLGWQWFKFRKYFPLAERSPILSIFFLSTSVMYLLSYPAFLQIPFLRDHINSLTAKCILIPLGNTYTYIYLIKSIRLAWGFNPKQDKFPKSLQSIFNAILSKERILIICCVFFLVFNGVTSILPSSGYYHEFDFVKINESTSLDLPSMALTNIIENSIGLTYLLISIILVRKVDERVNFLSELYLITVFDFILGGIRNILLFSKQSDDFCYWEGVALLYFLNAIKLISALYIGMVLPMQQLNTEHTYQNTFIIDQLDYFLHNYSGSLSKFIKTCINQKSLLTASSSSAQSNDQFKSRLRMHVSNIYTPSNHNNNQSAHTPSSSNNNNNNSNESNNNNNNNTNLTSELSYDSRIINKFQIEGTLGQSQESDRTREIFLRKHDFNLSLIYFKIYQESLIFKQKPSPKNQGDFIQLIKIYLIEQKRIFHLFSKLFPQPLQQRVNEWLENKRQVDIQNSNEIDQQLQLQQQVQGLQGIQEQDNRQEDADFDQLQQPTILEGEIQNSQSYTLSVIQTILDDIIKHSKQQLEQIFNEYMKTISFKTLKLYLEELSCVYSHILLLRLAYDQNTTI